MKATIINTLIWLFLIVVFFSLTISIIVAIFAYPKYSACTFIVGFVIAMAFAMGKENPIYKKKEEV